MTEREGTDDKGPGVVVHPPVLFFATLLAGLVLQFLFPLRFVNSLLVQLSTGLLVIGVGLGLGGWASKTVLKAGTELNPHSPVRSLVTHGPFRFSRNPLYLSGIIILLGIAVAVDTLWLILPMPIGLILISLQVRREEEYLEARFGEEYRKNKGRVRRWL